MRPLYMPNQLFLAKEAIKEKHGLTNRSIHTILNKKELHRMLKEIQALTTQGQIERYALTLTTDQVYMLSYYAPENNEGIRMSNLLAILYLVMTKEAFGFLYNQWQRYYEKGHCAPLLQKMLQSDLGDKAYLKEVHLTQENMGNWLKGESIPYAVVKSCMALDNKERVLANQLAYFGIELHTELAVECKRLFYLACERKHYEAVDRSNLEQIVRAYKDKEVKLFIGNFLAKMPFDTLHKYISLLNCLLEITSERGTRKYDHFFADVPYDTRKKYEQWINLYEINKIFDNDSRGVFWKEYALYEKCTFYNIPKYQLIVLDFDTHIFIEFKKMGPIYMFEKQYFYDEIQKKFFTFRNTPELRSWLKNAHENASIHTIERIAHVGYWENKVNRLIHQYIKDIN